MKKLIIIVVVVGVLIWLGLKVSLRKDQTPIVENTEPIAMCYWYSEKTDSGFFDRAWIHMDIQNGTGITGEFQNLPAEKDKKIGKIKGTAGPLDQKMMGRVANLWWNSMAEGMQNKEELIVKFGDGSAVAGFGEMVLKSDGSYVYKDKAKLTYGETMSQIACEDLDEILAVESYVKANIEKLSLQKPTLGGKWYVISVEVSGAVENGKVVYEDGHVQSEANFDYKFNAETKEVTISNFKVK